jgi:hypothetical protein
VLWYHLWAYTKLIIFNKGGRKWQCHNIFWNVRSRLWKKLEVSTLVCSYYAPFTSQESRPHIIWGSNSKPSSPQIKFTSQLMGMARMNLAWYYGSAEASGLELRGSFNQFVVIWA